MKPTPKQLILSLLQATQGQPLSARDAVSACALFGLRENAVRVALVRLANSGLIEAAARGSYQLGSQGRALATELAAWRDCQARLCDWQGDWLGVHTSHLGRSDRSVLRIRERALSLNGFRELQRGLLVRPNNLIGGAASVRERLLATGLEPAAAVFCLRDLPAELEQQARQLWDSAALEQGYQRTSERLRDWLKRRDQFEPEAAARESFLLGNQAIHQLVFDPLLPEPLVDTASRHQFITCLLEFERIGRSIWQSWPTHTTGAAHEHA